MRALEFIIGHVKYNPAYTYKFQLKTTLVSLFPKKFWMEFSSSDRCVFCTVFTLNQESRDPFKTCTPDFRLKDIRIQIEIPNVQK